MDFKKVFEKEQISYEEEEQKEEEEEEVEEEVEVEGEQKEEVEVKEECESNYIVNLEEIVDNSRTDKNTVHSYLPLYQKLLSSKKKPLKMYWRLEYIMVEV